MAYSFSDAKMQWSPVKDIPKFLSHYKPFILIGFSRETESVGWVYVHLLYIHCICLLYIVLLMYTVYYIYREVYFKELAMSFWGLVRLKSIEKVHRLETRQELMLQSWFQRPSGVRSPSSLGHLLSYLNLQLIR